MHGTGIRRWVTFFGNARPILSGRARERRVVIVNLSVFHPTTCIRRRGGRGRPRNKKRGKKVSFFAIRRNPPHFVSHDEQYFSDRTSSSSSHYKAVYICCLARPHIHSLYTAYIRKKWRQAEREFCLKVQSSTKRTLLVCTTLYTLFFSRILSVQHRGGNSWQLAQKSPFGASSAKRRSLR